ncbi:MAG: response regulator [Bacteroidales bacterium]|nr:response regulator [Bacteroidales bacterium]
MFTKTTIASDLFHDNVVFDQIKFENSQSFGIVEDIVQDKYGFIWIGAKDGLYRYDGVNFRLYILDKNDRNSLSNNVIRDIFIDSKDRMWIATENGLNLYNDDKDNFTRYFDVPEDSTLLNPNYFTKIAEDKDNNLWIASIYSGLCKFNPATGKFNRYTTKSQKGQQLSTNNILTVYIDSEGIIWAGTNYNGVHYIIPGDTRVQLLKDGPKDGKHISGPSISSIVEAADGSIWFGTMNSGISCYNKKTEEFKYYYKNHKKNTALGSNIVRNLFRDSDDMIWICTEDGGLNLYSPSEDSFRQFRVSESDPTSISTDIVRCVFEDDAGNFWIGNFNAPINYIDTQRKKFLNIRVDPNNKNSLSHNHVLSIMIDSDKLLWIGTDGGGLNKYNPETGHFTVFKQFPGNTQSLSNNKPTCLEEDSEGNIWIGFYGGGLGYYNKKTGKFLNYFPDGTYNNPTNSHIWDLLIDDNKLWIVGEHCIETMDLGTNKFKILDSEKANSKNTNVTGSWYLYKDSKQRILIGTVNGLKVYTPSRNTWQIYSSDMNNPKSLSDNWIIYIMEDSKSRIWIGTHGGGLNIWEESNNTFKSYNTRNGLSGNVINAIQEDSKGNLWISTNKGLTKFNYDSLEFVNYDVNDGIQDNRFNIAATFKDKNGCLYFGGINGLTYFYPKDIVGNTYIPPIVFTGFELFNEEVKIGNPNSPVNKNMHLLNEIYLKYRDRVFTIKFNALSYTQPYKNKYRYMLEGFEDNWNPSSEKNYATYTNLSPGRYTFKVQASNNDNVWNLKGISMNIIVDKPFYKTIWFITLIAFLIALTIVGIYRIRVRNIRIRNQTLSHLVSERTREIEKHIEEIANQKEEITRQRDIATSQRDKIILQNEELEMHRNRLTELIEERTRELLIAKEKAEEGDKLKTAFLENISHEIRTPMNAILGFINLLIDKKDDEKLRDYYLNIINESGKSMLRLIEDIIDFSRMQTGDLELVYEECNVTEVIKNLITHSRDKASRDRPGINIIPQLPEKEIRMITDQKKLEQIFSKLVENSLKFTEKGHIKIGLNTIEDKLITFMVEDTGTGIEENQLEKIFDRFFKVQEESSNKVSRGAGLGLAFAKLVTEILGGKIWAESKLKKGSTFYFSLPYTSVDTNTVTLTEENTLTEYSWPGKRILIAEDEESNYLLIEAIFKDAGVEIIHATDGVEMLEIIDEDKNIDLILLDIKMPRLSGLNAIKIIRESNETVPVIAQTAYDQAYHRAKCIEYGCNDFLTKPLKKKELLEIVKRYLG